MIQLLLSLTPVPVGLTPERRFAVSTVQTSRIIEPSTANGLLIEFVRKLCLAENDRVTGARPLYRKDWRRIERNVERDITYYIDTPTKRHDRISEVWRGPVQGGSAQIATSKISYKEPGGPDSSSAMVWVTPERLVDIDGVMTEHSLTLTPLGEPIIRPGGIEVRYGDGRVTKTGPWGGRLQHYRMLRGSRDIGINAMRIWGEGYREQVWRLECSSGDSENG